MRKEEGTEGSLVSKQTIYILSESTYGSGHITASEPIQCPEKQKKSPKSGNIGISENLKIWMVKSRFFIRQFFALHVRQHTSIKLKHIQTKVKFCTVQYTTVPLSYTSFEPHREEVSTAATKLKSAKYRT